ncbi:hypothetical protein ABH931_006877 [Streptacidiphilus sp. MAP12-33]|uniref:hypothetical protein n=1 Tax=Streptacidiphilus sp. MAP12-33 TaxID=3156266 RepID=UPI003512175E
MTARSYVLGLLVVGYAGFAFSGILIAAAGVAGAAHPHEFAAFFAVVAVLAVVAGFLGGRLAAALGRVWDRRWDEYRVSWAVREAEQILRADPGR